MCVIKDVLRRIHLILALLLMASLRMAAQQDPLFSHYWAMEPQFNPAAVGKEQKLNVAAAYNITMAGFTRQPRTMYVGADMPFMLMNSLHGAGIQLINDDIGLFSHRRLSLQYAYKLKLFGGQLGIGVQGGLLSENFNTSKVDVNDSGDNVFEASEITGTGIDLSAGLYYTHKYWYVGVSGLHLTAPKVLMGENNEIQMTRSYYLTGGCNIRLRNPFLTIHPSFMCRYDGTGYRGDVGARLKYTHDKKVMYIGVGYSPTNSITAFVGGMFHGIMIGYSYEYYTSAISFGNGSHELMVGYQTNLNLYKKGRNRHQSVRIL